MKSLLKIKQKYAEGEKLVFLTAYDALTSSVLEESGVDCLLVGDSLSNVVAGFGSTIPVGMEAMLWHVAMTVRGVSEIPVIADMPFMSYEVSAEQALMNAGRFVKEAGASAVKLEGGVEYAETIRALTRAHIPVCGHVGLQPQSVLALGRYSVRGREKEEAERIKNDALAVQEAGAFAVVLEMVPGELAAEITGMLEIPTVGIGAGPGCSGQILVTQDLLGLMPRAPKFVKPYASLRDEIKKAVSAYASDVREGKVPSKEQTF